MGCLPNHSALGLPVPGMKYKEPSRSCKPPRRDANSEPCKVRITRAANPSDILWENLGVPPSASIWQGAFTSFAGPCGVPSTVLTEPRSLQSVAQNGTCYKTVALDPQGSGCGVVRVQGFHFGIREDGSLTSGIQGRIRGNVRSPAGGIMKCRGHSKLNPKTTHLPTPINPKCHRTTGHRSSVEVHWQIAVVKEPADIMDLAKYLKADET